MLLIYTGEKIFRQIIPWLILFASLLLAVGEPLRKWIVNREKNHPKTNSNRLASALPIGFAAIYGGYFGAGLSVIELAFLGLMLDDSLTRLNALKQAIAFATNTAAAIFFLFSGKVVWSIAAVMAISALLGGTLGGKFARQDESISSCAGSSLPLA